MLELLLLVHLLTPDNDRAAYCRCNRVTPAPYVWTIRIPKEIEL